MNLTMLDSPTPVTMVDIQEVAPVSSRSIRSWVSQGLLPKPIKIGGGRAQGSVAYYPAEALEMARYIYEVRRAARTPQLLHLVQRIGTSQVLVGVDSDGLPTLIYRPKSFQGA